MTQESHNVLTINATDATSAVIFDRARLSKRVLLVDLVPSRVVHPSIKKFQGGVHLERNSRGRAASDRRRCLA